MQNKLSAVLALISSVSMIALGGCFYSSRAPDPYYYGGPAYSAPYAAPKKVTRRAIVGMLLATNFCLAPELARVAPR